VSPPAERLGVRPAGSIPPAGELPARRHLRRRVVARARPGGGRAVRGVARQGGGRRRTPGKRARRRRQASNAPGRAI